MRRGTGTQGVRGAMSAQHAGRARRDECAAHKAHRAPVGAERVAPGTATGPAGQPTTCIACMHFLLHHPSHTGPITLPFARRFRLSIHYGNGNGGGVTAQCS